MQQRDSPVINSRTPGPGLFTYEFLQCSEVNFASICKYMRMHFSVRIPFLPTANAKYGSEFICDYVVLSLSLSLPLCIACKVLRIDALQIAVRKKKCIPIKLYSVRFLLGRDFFLISYTHSVKWMVAYRRTRGKWNYWWPSRLVSCFCSSILSCCTLLRETLDVSPSSLLLLSRLCSLRS